MVKKIPYPQIVGPSYSYPSLPIDCQKSVNFESIKIDSPDAKTRFALISTPGIKARRFRYNNVVTDYVPTTYEGRIRGFHYTSTGFFGQTARALVIVAAESVYEVSPADSQGIHDLRKIGTVSNLSGSVSMVDDGYVLTLADNATIYQAGLQDGSFASLGTEAPLQCTSTTYLGGYTIVSGKVDGVPSNSYFFRLDSNPTWNALNFASAELRPDPIDTVKAVGGDLWLLGSSSYEVHQQTGNARLPFTRVSGSATIGSAAPKAVASIGNQIFFLGAAEAGNFKVYTNRGYEVLPISTDALEQTWSSYQAFSDAIGWCYSQYGRTYYAVTWLTDDITYVYCLESNSWHQRASRDAATDTFKKWVVADGVFAYDKIFVGSINDTKIYDLSRSYYTDDGNSIVRIRRTPHIHNGLTVLMHRAITLDMETGIGTETGQGVNPQIMLRYSSDGGRALWSAERWKSAGKLGAYRTRPQWRNLGIARDRVYEIYCSDPVSWTIMGAELEVESSVAGI